MIERGLALQAFGYAAASVLLALAAVFAGLSISRALLGTVLA
jgi:fluoride ion exporter CrcB/FEX